MEYIAKTYSRHWLKIIDPFLLLILSTEKRLDLFAHGVNDYLHLTLSTNNLCEKRLYIQPTDYMN